MLRRQAADAATAMANIRALVKNRALCQVSKCYLVSTSQQSCFYHLNYTDKNDEVQR